MPEGGHSVFSHVALVGTKVQANFSKRKAMSQERMLRTEKVLQKEINVGRYPGCPGGSPLRQGQDWQRFAGCSKETAGPPGQNSSGP